MFRIVSIIITIALMVWLAMHFDLIGGGGDKTSSASQAIQQAQDAVQQDAGRTIQQDKQLNQYGR